MASREMSNTPLTPLRDEQLTTCITQLAERALELQEPQTAVVLFALAGHRIVGVDYVMALTANAHSIALREKINENKNNENDNNV